MKKFKQFTREDALDVLPRDLERRIKRALHRKSYLAALRQYMVDWERDSESHDKRDLAAKVARQYKGVETRPFIQYISSLAKKGDIPKKMALEEKDEDI